MVCARRRLPGGCAALPGPPVPRLLPVGEAWTLEKASWPEPSPRRFFPTRHPFLCNFGGNFPGVGKLRAGGVFGCERCAPCPAPRAGISFVVVRWLSPQ